MPVIYLNCAHTPSSPGGVFGGHTEYGDSRRLCFSLYEKLKALDAYADIRLSGGKIPRDIKRDDLLFVFHRGTAIKQYPSKGAEIFVKESAGAKIQYEAYRLLSCLCGDGGFRYRRVRTATAKCPFGAFRRALPQRAYLIKAGFIDSEGDNEIFERGLESFAELLAGEIIKIYKENINEDNG